MSILLSALACLPGFLFQLFTNENLSYFPLQNFNFTKPVLAAGFPVNIIGMMIIIITWGFFEGFSYVVLSDRINKLLPSKRLLIYGMLVAYRCTGNAWGCVLIFLFFWNGIGY